MQSNRAESRTLNSPILCTSRGSKQLRSPMAYSFLITCSLRNIDSLESYFRSCLSTYCTYRAISKLILARESYFNVIIFEIHDGSKKHSNVSIQLLKQLPNLLRRIMAASFPPGNANLFGESIVIHFSARVGVPEVIALSSCVLAFSRPRVRDVTCPRKQVAIQAGD